MSQTKKFEGKIVFTITDQSKIDPYSDFESWETLTVTFERLKRPPLAAAHAVGQIYEVPPPGSVIQKKWDEGGMSEWGFKLLKIDSWD